MSDHRDVPGRVAQPIIGKLNDEAYERMGRDGGEGLPVEAQEKVLREVAASYNDGQTKFDAELISRRGDCPCGNCVSLRFGLRYRTYH